MIPVTRKKNGLTSPAGSIFGHRHADMWYMCHS